MATLAFRDPVFDGATDPVVVWNRSEGCWWMIYTSRRATAPTPGLGWVHGSDVGVASSPDGGRTWTYRGTLRLEQEFGRNTFWAPEVLWARGSYHMFVSYVQGVPETWEGHRRHIMQYTSPDLEQWHYCGRLPLSSDYVIDAAVHARPEGGYRLWYKDEADGSSTWSVDSADLSTWERPRRVLATPGGHEGPNVFSLGGWYWLIVDCWSGQLVHRSGDMASWEPAGKLLGPETACPATCAEDVGPGFHADVVVDGERALVFYFTHPLADGGGRGTYEQRRTAILMAELEVRDGQLVCERSRPVTHALLVPSNAGMRKDKV
jgi:hypothetical protein